MDIPRSLVNKVCNVVAFDEKGRLSISAKVISMNNNFILLENSHGFRSLFRKDQIVKIRISTGYYKHREQMNSEQISSETL